MTAQETKKALTAIALQCGAGIDDKLAALPREAKNERSALMIVKNFSQHCAMFVNLDFAGRYYEIRERRVFRELPHFAACRTEWEALDEEARQCFLVYAFAFAMVEHNFLRPHRSEGGTAEERFKNSIIRTLLTDILTRWQAWWRANGTLRCEVEL